jgi:hypothetical protein
MPPIENAVPAYRRQRDTNGADRAFVRLGGRRIFLGPSGSPESREAYARTIAEWSAGRSFWVGRKTDRLTVTELVVRFMEHADRYYGTDGPTARRPVRPWCSSHR